MSDTEPDDARVDRRVTVVVLAGGTSRRFGADKLAAPLGASTVLDRLLDTLPVGWPVILVGPARETVRSDAVWVREHPSGGGPLAGVAAAAAMVATELVAVVAGDMPFAAPALATLVAALDVSGPDVGGAVARVDGRSNALLAAYRADALRAVLPASPHGLPARTLLAVPHVAVAVPVALARDVDTTDDLETARAHLGRPPR
ncbi:molybdenum cofactor guanylyltransferase [Intrasporangium sp. YIM S08009]|uniref:molybdenum cofactor guanylyltransferase n=1 Tax=Intrasporangium zincisolvens TaxID=3080018 RepID=UPI002B0518C5|nr:NTP transferase domain-containing protein [Intrasporangium sp. YIM S08009]